LTIEDPNTIDSELVDTPPPTPLISAPLRKPKWEKRLPKHLSISTLDAQGTSLLLPVEIGTTDTSELHSVKALLDSGATGSFIDRDFVRSKGINTRTLSRNISVFNVDGSPNEAGQIMEVEMTRCPLRCEGGRALWKEQTRQKRTELRALQSCRDGPTPLLQEESESEEEPPQTHHSSWEPGDRLFLTR